MRRALLIALLLASTAHAVTTSTSTSTSSTSTVVSEPMVQRQFIADHLATVGDECAAVKAQCAEVLAGPSPEEYEAALGRHDQTWLVGHPPPDFARRDLCERARSHCQGAGAW